MPGTNTLTKAQQAEADTFHNLGIKRDLATALLLDQGRLISNIRTPQSYLSKLETAVNKYETAFSTVIAVTEEKDIKIPTRRNLLHNWRI